jgi:hypothetical protein
MAPRSCTRGRWSLPGRFLQAARPTEEADAGRRHRPTGSVGTSLLAALAGEPQVTAVLKLAKRRSELELSKTAQVEADVIGGDLVGTSGKPTRSYTRRG